MKITLATDDEFWTESLVLAPGELRLAELNDRLLDASSRRLLDAVARADHLDGAPCSILEFAQQRWEQRRSVESSASPGCSLS